MFAWAGDLEEAGTDGGAGHGGEAGGEVAEVGTGGGVVGHAETVDVEKTVTGCDFGFGGLFGINGRVVGEEFGKVVVIYLFGDGVFGCWMRY